jgi:tetratricopeptide (TPR) repeat protein
MLLLLAPCVCGEEPTPPSETDARIQFYQSRIGGPGTYPAYARLGAAYMQKARETGRHILYDDAVTALQTSLQYQRNYEALFWLATAQLARHEFQDAQGYAQETIATRPSDLGAQGTLFDISLALGDIEAAEAVLEKMRLAQTHSAYYARLATLQEVRGNLTGALEAIEKTCALIDTQSSSIETRAWCHVRLGALSLLSHCETEKSEAAYQRALTFVPQYHLALEHLAELRVAQARDEEAMALYHHLIKTTENPVHRLSLADIYAQRGNRENAETERSRALADLRGWAKHGSRAFLRPLALLLLDRQETAAEGLEWARKDWENRRDFLAADTLAWALHRNGDTPKALQTVQDALRTGSKEGSILLHAALIYVGADHRPEARKLLDQALICPLALRPADRAQAEKLLAELQKE